MTLRMRMDFGVTSTYSSSLMYSRASSRLNTTGGDDAGLVVGTRCAHVGELLGFGDVDHEVVVVDVLTYYLSGIYFVLWVDEEAAAVLQLVDGVGKCGAGFE